MFRPILASLALILGVPLAAAQPDEDDFDPVLIGERLDSQLDIRTDPFVNLHFLARHAAAAGSTPPALDGFNEVVEAIGVLDKSLGGPRGWQQFEGNISRCSTAQEAASRFESLPETVTIGGTAVLLREPALCYARALGKIESAYLREVWPAHSQRLERARADLEARFLPHQTASLDFVMSSFAMTNPRISIPVFLVFSAPRPGASTVSLRGGGAACFVAVDGVPPGALVESVLHESIHAIDLATSAQDTALNRLRRLLDEAGVPATDPRVRDCWHTLMFIQAGETIKRLVDPAHEHYGDTAGYYAKVPEMAALERPIWTEYLDKKISLDKALSRIVAGFPKPATSER